MSAAELLAIAAKEGVVLMLDGDRLTWESDHQPPAELLESIRAHKNEVITALSAANDPEAVSTPKQAAESAWLGDLAALMLCEPAYLLEHGFIDQHDLIEQNGSDLPAAARLIRSNPAWRDPPQESVRHTPDLLIAQGQAYWTGAEPQHVVHTAHTASPAWIKARDQFYAHLTSCAGCYAPTGTICNVGADLKAIYEEIG